MPRSVLAAGTLSTTSTRLYYPPTGREAEVRINFANNSSATTVNCHVDPARFTKTRLIGLDTAIAVKGTIEIGNDVPIRLGPGDELWGDAAGSVDYVISGTEYSI